MAEVRVHNVHLSLDIVEPVGPLSAEDVRRIATLVLEMVKTDGGEQDMRRRDTRIRDRVWDPEGD